MRFDKLTLRAQEAVQDAQQVAEKFQHANIDVEHLFVTLLKQPEGVVGPILEKLSVEPGHILREVEEELGRQPKVAGGTAGYGANITGRLQKVFNDAFKEADPLQDAYISGEHFLLGIVQDT